jgi:hypothetical protein
MAGMVLLAMGLLVVFVPSAQADPAANQTIHSVTTFEHQDAGDTGCSRGVFRARGVLTDHGVARTCDRHPLKQHGIVGNESFDGSTGHYQLTYKLFCNNDFSICDGTWQFNQGALRGSGTTHQVVTENGDGTETLDCQYSGHVG